MGRYFLSSFLVLSNSSPRFTSSTLSRVRNKLLRKSHGTISPRRLPVGVYGTSHCRCYCCSSVPKTAVSENSTIPVKIHTDTSLIYNRVGIARWKICIPLKEVAQECQNMNWGTFKVVLTDALIDHLHPIQVRYEEIISDTANLDGVLAEGAMKAADTADVTLDNVYQAMGFLKR